MSNVILVNVGSDSAVYVGDEHILSAAPTCGDSVEAVSTVAGSLAALFGVELVVVDEEPPCEDWDWVDVETVLLEKGVIKRFDIQAQKDAVKDAHRALSSALDAHVNMDRMSHDPRETKDAMGELERVFPEWFDN